MKYLRYGSFRVTGRINNDTLTIAGVPILNQSFAQLDSTISLGPSIL
jgi:hypothetical protein